MDRQNEIENYIREQEIFAKALKSLKRGREIAFQLEDETHFVMFYKDGVKTEFRQPKTADVRFHASDAAVEKILASHYPTIADFGAEVLRFIASKKMRIEILTGPFKLLTGGYVEIIRLGGADFFSRLSEFGIKGPTDILKLFKKLKKG